jgi:hypothetical protein
LRDFQGNANLGSTGTRINHLFNPLEVHCEQDPGR